MAVRVRPNKMVAQTDTVAFFELDADTADDLTGLTTIGSFTIAAGSLCQVIATGHIYTLNGSGSWVDQMGDAS